MGDGGWWFDRNSRNKKLKTSSGRFGYRTDSLFESNINGRKSSLLSSILRRQLNFLRGNL